MSDETNMLSASDHYDASEHFDDVMSPVSKAPPREVQVDAARKIVRQAQISRLPPPELQVEDCDDDEVIGECLTDDVLGELLGVAGDDEESGTPAPFTPVDSSDFPMTQQLHRKFKAAMPTPKIVRIDTERTYVTFCNAERAPYIADLQDKMFELEQADDSQNVDGKTSDVLGEEVRQAAARAEVGGDEINLALPPGTEKHVRCWQNGKNVCVSMRVPGPDGQPRIVTTATPIDRHHEEVLGYAVEAGVDPVEVMGILPALAQVFGGGALVTQISRATPALMEHPPVVSGESATVKVIPVADPAVAAVMALMQLAKQGNKVATKEVKKLRAMPNSKALFDAADKGFAQAQKEQG